LITLKIPASGSSVYLGVKGVTMCPVWGSLYAIFTLVSVENLRVLLKLARMFALLFNLARRKEYVKMCADVLFNVECEACGQPMAELDQDEFYWLMIMGSGAGQCFTCHPARATMKPDLFLGKEEGDFFQIDDIGLMVEDGEFKMAPHALAQAHDAIALLSLSSSTYLNSPLSKTANEKGFELAVCRVCEGDGKQFGQYGHIETCERCGGRGLVETAIFIPSWLVGIARTHD
jgi:hypothetical protein